MSLYKYQVFDEMLEGVQVIDKSLKYVYVNEAVALQAKVPKESLPGHKMIEKFPGIEKTIVYQYIQQCLDDNESHQFTTEFEFQDGSVGYFELRMQPVPEGLLIMSFDITEQKKAEMLVKDHNQRLEELVQLRMKEVNEQKVLMEGQLQELIDLSNIKDKFLALVAHDLRGPLTSLRLFTQLIDSNIDSWDKDTLKEVNMKLSKSIESTIMLTQNLTEWAKGQMQKHETHTKRVKVSEVVQEVFGLYENEATLKNIHVINKVPKDVVVLADKNQLAFVIRNVIDNAIKYTSGPGSISVVSKYIAYKKLEIQIADTGIGIPEGKWKELFTFKGSGYSQEGTDGEKGTGLGLVLSHDFMSLNGGDIRVGRSPEGGTVVFLTLQKVEKD